MKRSGMVLTLVLAFASTACVLLKTDERIDVVVAAVDRKRRAKPILDIHDDFRL